MNTYEQLMNARESGLPDVAIIRATIPAASRSGGVHVVGWAIWRPGKRLRSSKGLAFYERADKLPFNERDYPGETWRESRTGALAAAKQYAKSNYHVTEWKRNVFGDYVDSRVNKQFPIPKRQKVSA